MLSASTGSSLGKTAGSGANASGIYGRARSAASGGAAVEEPIDHKAAP